MGGSIAIIVDSIKEDTSRIVMSDDGRGDLVSIPSLLISNQDGNKIKNQTNKEIIVRVPLLISNPDNRVEYDLYYSTILDLLEIDFDGFNRIDSLL